jgi:hypothetical protein
MVRLFIDVGRNHRISPADIVGAIANEGGVPGKAIGAIDVYDRFTFVEFAIKKPTSASPRRTKSPKTNDAGNVRAADFRKTTLRKIIKNAKDLTADRKGNSRSVKVSHSKFLKDEDFAHENHENDEITKK